MKLDIRVNKDTCFYFWIQVVSGWDPHLISQRTLSYYKNGMPKEHQPTLDKIKLILQNHKQPRAILSDLYSGKLSLPEAKIIAEEAELLKNAFEPFWHEALPHLEQTQTILGGSALAKFIKPMEEAADFLNSNFKVQDAHSCYLIQNIPGHNSWGLSINRNELMMAAPSRSGLKNELRNTVCVIAHEYIHAIEFASRTSRELISQSYCEHIEPRDIPHPAAYEWKMMYVEAITYCFVSPSIGGYMRPELFNKNRPTAEEMEGGFWKLVENQSQTTEQVINWVALSILPDVEAYIKHGKKIDQHIVDKISHLFVEFYLTRPT